MGESKRRGTFEERKAEAVSAGRKSGALGQLQRDLAIDAKNGKSPPLDVKINYEPGKTKAA